VRSAVGHAPTVEPARTASTRAAGGWLVQVGSFASRGNADRLARELKRKGYGAFVAESVSRGRKWYRVRIGPERDRAAAAAVAKRLRAAGRKGEVIPPG
jgi:DedD protein